MFRLLMQILLMACLAVCSSPAARAEPPGGVIEGDATKPVAPLSIADIFQKTSPAVVKILVNGESHKGVATGSGFIVSWPTSDSCEIITNHHVIRAAVDATVEFENGAIADVETVLIESDSADLALFEAKLRKKVPIHPSWPPDVRAKMEAEVARENKPPARCVIDLKPDLRPPVGTRVIAIGSPQGMTNTLSDGLISGYRTADSKDGWIQITNPIGPGSSGGPLLDEAGRFVGITTGSIEDSQNLNFAVPGSAVRALVEHKRTPRPLWKGSSIHAEEKAVYRLIFSQVFERFCGSSDDLKNERERSDDYLRAVSGIAPVLNERSQRFRKYCEDLAQINDPFALIVTGYYTAQDGKFESPARIKEGIESLQRALKMTDRYQFYVLYAIGEAEWYLAQRAREAANAQTSPTPAEYARAIECLEKAHDANPDFAPSLNLLAILLTETGQYPAALSATKALLDRVPGSATARVQRAELLAATGSTLEAIVEFERALRLDPYQFQAAHRRGQLYSQTSQHEKAIEAYNALIRIVEHDPAKGAMEQLGVEYFGSLYAEFLWEIRRSIGWEYVRLGRFDEAIASLEHALRSPGVDDDPGIRPALQQDIATCLRMRSANGR